MQSIVTKRLSPTDTSGARVKATAANGASVIVPYSYEGDGVADDRAAVKLAAKLGWTGTLVRGSTKDGYAYVFANDHHVTIGANAAGGRRTAHRAGGKRPAKRAARSRY